MNRASSLLSDQAEAAGSCSLYSLGWCQENAASGSKIERGPPLILSILVTLSCQYLLYGIHEGGHVVTLPGKCSAEHCGQVHGCGLLDSCEGFAKSVC